MSQHHLHYPQNLVGVDSAASVHKGNIFRYAEEGVHEWGGGPSA